MLFILNVLKEYYDKMCNSVSMYVYLNLYKQLVSNSGGHIELAGRMCGESTQRYVEYSVLYVITSKYYYY